MERDKKILSAALAVSLAISSCGQNQNSSDLPVILSTPTDRFNSLATPTIVSPTPTITPTPTRTPEPGSSSGSIYNPTTTTYFQRTPNFTGASGQCVILGIYSDSSKQDVVGAATALGTDPGQYRDHYAFTVYWPDHTEMGTFTTDISPQYVPFPVVPPRTIVCES